MAWPVNAKMAGCINLLASQCKDDWLHDLLIQSAITARAGSKQVQSIQSKVTQLSWSESLVVHMNGSTMAWGST